MSDQRIQATENMIGANHPTLADTLNRLTLVQHNADGTHKTGISALPWTDAASSGGINATVAAIGSTVTTMAVTNAQTLSASLVIPATLSVIVLQGGSITTTGYTLTVNGPFSGVGQVFGGTGTVLGLSSVRPEWFGTNDTGYTKAIAALSSGGILDATQTGNSTFAAQVTVNQPITMLFGNQTITGPASGYIFDITVNGVNIPASNLVLSLSTGGVGGIRNNQAQNTTIGKMIINMNSVANAIGLYHYGGWNNHYSDIQIPNNLVAATSDGMAITSLDGYNGVHGAAGPTGSYGGAYLGTYENIATDKVRITATLPNKTTTQTFVNLSVNQIIATNTLGLTFLQPVVQATANSQTLITLNNVAGFTAIGGDFESGSFTGVTTYNISNSSRGIQSINNSISGATQTYMTGQATAGSYFHDDFTSAATGQFHGYIGSLETITYGNSGFVNMSHVGKIIDANNTVFSENLTPISTTQGNLDDVSKAGMALVMNTSGQLLYYFAAAGANPRSLTQSFLWSYSLASYATNAAAITGGLSVGTVYRNGDVLQIVH